MICVILKRIDHVKLAGKVIDVHAINAAEIYKSTRTLGYQDTEIEEIIKLLIKRGMLEFYQQYILREVPSQTVDIDGISYQLDELFNELKLLQKGFPENNQLAGVVDDAHKWEQAVNQERQSGQPDPQRIHLLGKSIRVRQGDLRTFALDRQRELLKQGGITRQGIHPIGQQYLDVLNTPIVGAVNYVDQVNALRRVLQTYSNTVKADIDRLSTRLDKTIDDLKSENLPYETLSRCATEMSELSGQVERAKKGYAEFEVVYRHLGAWQGLVSEGSALVDELQQMGRMTAEHMTEFERLSREISGRISSSPNKLDLLGDHSIFTNRLSNLRQQVRAIRLNAETAFVDLQNRYYQSLTNNGLFKRDQIGRTLTYNLGNPEELYRLIFERIQELVLALCEKMSDVIRSERQDVLNTLNTPLLAQLPDDDRDRIHSEGQALEQDTTQMLNSLSRVYTEAQDMGHIQDEMGVYSEVIKELVDVRDEMAQMSRRARDIGTWLTQFELSPLEQALQESFPNGNIDVMIDLLEWRNCQPNIGQDDFWTALRGLYEKRRIRLDVGSVRR